MRLRSGDWLGLDINVLLLEPTRLLPWPCVLAHCLAGIPIHDPFSMPWPWRYMALSIVPLIRCSCPVPLAEIHPQSIMFPPPCLTVGMVFFGVTGSISPPLKTASWVDAKELDFGLNMVSTTTLLPSSPLNHWQTSDRPVHVLSWAGGPCGRCRISVLHGVVCYQLFSWWLWSQLPWEIIDNIPPCSSGLIPHRSHDHWNSTRWDLA